MITLRKLALDHPDIPKVWKLFQEAFHESSEYYSYEDTEYVLAGSEEPVDTDAVLRLFSRYEGELFA